MWFLDRLVPLLGGVLLDILMGDPVFAAHPVRLVGNFASLMETFWRKLFPPFIAGIAAWICVMAISAAAGQGILALLGLAGGAAGRWVGGLAGGITGIRIGSWVGASFLVWASIALRDLTVHANRIRSPLAAGDLPAARKALGFIVGRDVQNLDKAGVARGAVESIAESFIDGYAAPLFWAAVFGPLGAFAYRSANTMDSMFGHKNETYLRFGFLSAKADDWATFVPARLASALACAVAPLAGGSLPRTMRVFLRDRLKHESPNSAHSEAVFAGALGVELGGSVSYHGEVLEKPRLGLSGREPEVRDIERALRLLWLSALAWLAFLILLLELWNYIASGPWLHKLLNL
jgi:adenosylcobinamide-phosphate synthase